MQLDFFSAAAEPFADLELIAHSSAEYGPRTAENARAADATVAFAADYETAGERLTHRLAAARYVAVPLLADVAQSAARLLAHLRALEARTLNVAGNGIYTLSAHGISQDEANFWVYQVLARVHQAHPLTRIRSGGQTGVDTAALVAGLALGIPVLGLYPKGFRQRLASKRDVLSDPKALEAEIRLAASRLLHARNLHPDQTSS